MIKAVYGDILLSKAEAIAHGVAPDDDFSQGLALSLREKWPALYKDFRHCCQTSHPKSGEIWTWAGADSRRIVCLMTQQAAYDKGEKPGKATVQFVDHALKALRQLVEVEQIKSVALPRLATRVGDLDWREVKPLIVKHFGDLKIPVYLYTIFEEHGCGGRLSRLWTERPQRAFNTSDSIVEAEEGSEAIHWLASQH